MPTVGETVNVSIGANSYQVGLLPCRQTWFNPVGVGQITRRNIKFYKFHRGQRFCADLYIWSNSLRGGFSYTHHGITIK